MIGNALGVSACFVAQKIQDRRKRARTNEPTVTCLPPSAILHYNYQHMAHSLSWLSTCPEQTGTWRRQLRRCSIFGLALARGVYTPVGVDTLCTGADVVGIARGATL